MSEKQTGNSQYSVGATPLHVRILEKALDLTPFLNYSQEQLTELMKKPVSEQALDEDEPDCVGNYETVITAEDKKLDQSIYYNFNNVGEDRQWLRDLLLSMDGSEETEYSNENVTAADLKNMLKQHVYEKKYRNLYKQKSKYGYYKYYGASLLSKFDMYAENQKHNVIPKKKEKEPKRTVLRKVPKKSVAVKQEMHIPELSDNLLNDDNDWEDHDEEELGIGGKLTRQMISGVGLGSKASKRNNIINTPEQMAIRRRKLWILMCKKEMGKVQRSKANNHKEQLQTCKRTAQLCMKICRQKAMQSQKNMKETIWRCKRLTREMQSYWKRYDRVEREMRRRMEKEAEEQRKMDVEMIEAKRQQRKLNFLITQTELYAHFMSRKLGQASPEEQLRILNQLEEKKVTRLAPIDDYDSEVMKAKAKRNVIEAIENDRARTKQFDRGINYRSMESTPIDMQEFDLKGANTNLVEEHPQPALFKGHLKGYQLKGMNWLANLYDQGISGILADEMGLGKTVQSIAFLCHVAEKYSVWGPFLVISPASTLHNWQQEMARFVPDFRVVPYWGNPNERKILRQFWEQKDLHTKEASFHVVITSYQIIITDFKYFNRIKWQYMILDEAQAIKSSSSVRWKMLLGFSCRNRLLLSGTPIQNSMAELWALLHFIMPTLFDSHDEFNEWFSKDIENHVENKTGIDEKHLSRLHMILKPFMLRRIKKDVENELSDKIEIMVYCPLTRRQNLLYMALKKKIRIEDLLHYTVGGGDTNNVDKNFTSNLMNLVMQFRKVCNHPELFERRDSKSPVYVKSPDFVVPKLVYGWNKQSSKLHLLFNKFYIWSVEYITRNSYTNQDYNTFSFRSIVKLSAKELFCIYTNGILELINHYLCSLEYNTKLLHRSDWWSSSKRSDTCNQFMLLPLFKTSDANVRASVNLRNFIFTKPVETESRIYTFMEQRIRSMSDNYIRSELDDSESDIFANYLGDIDNIKPNRMLNYQATELPLFLSCYAPKVESKTIELYSSSNSLAVYKQRIHSQANLIEHAQIDNLEYSVTSQIMKNIKMAHSVRGWFNIVVPDKETLVTDAGKLSILDPLLKKLKQEGHRVLIYSQMTKMIDLLEEYMWHRKHKYMRLDGSSKISERRDMVADFQARTDIFVFLLSTRAGGLGINLTAADTVIFYDSDWNPTVDQQAMDRAHRLGQTKQVTVYRLICKGTIEERILQRAREKSEIQRMVISGGNFKPDTLKPKEVVSLLLDDEEIEMKYRQKAEERRSWEEAKERKERDRKRKQMSQTVDETPSKRIKDEFSNSGVYTPESRSERSSPIQMDEQACLTPNGQLINGHFDDSSNEGVLDVETPVSSQTTNNSQYSTSSGYSSSTAVNAGVTNKRVVRGGTRRGRPRGSRRGGGTGSKGRDFTPNTSIQQNGSSTVNSNTTSATPTPTSAAVGATDDDEPVPTTSAGTSSNGVGNNIETPSLQETVLLVDDTGQTKAVPIRRGPGRPRLKPVGPGNQGTRGIGLTRPRKPVRSLPVPLRPQSLANSQQQPTTSTFNFYGSSSPNSNQV